ncbi:Uncharacterised protein [Bordetella pertussis]|nr:Uncharacterised protein [Bordetella pertussis]
MRLLAAARLAAAGSCAKAATARTRAATWCSGGASAMTASTALRSCSPISWLR